MKKCQSVIQSRRFPQCRLGLALLLGIAACSASALAATPLPADAETPGILAVGFANEQANSPAPAGGSAPPSNQTRVGTWSLMADAQLQSVQLSDLSTSFGLGVAYRSLRTDTSLIVRKGTQGTIEDRALSAEFGHFALDPAASNVGASMRGMYFLNSGRYRSKCKGCDPTQTFPGLQVGIRVSLDVGQAQLKATLADATVESRSVAAGALSLGIVARVSDDLVLDGVERPIALGIYLSGVSHVIGGDLVAQERKDIFGNDAELYFGLQGGLFFQIASAEVTMKVSQIWPSGDRIEGLTGFQLVPRVTFSLPFDIVQYEPSAPAATPPATTTATPGTTTAQTGSTAAAGAGAAASSPSTDATVTGTAPAAATPATPKPAQ